MPHQLWLLETLPGLSQTKKTLQDGFYSCAQQKPHDTREREDTKGTTLQVLFLGTIKRVIFIVDISSKNKKNFSVISKYHLSISFWAQKKTVFLISENFKRKTL